MLRLMLATIFVTMSALATHAELTHAVLFKDPSCGCCDSYASLLRKDGYAVKVVNTDDLATVKREHRIPDELQGCHSTMISGYVIEGYVPLAIIRKLLIEKPKIKGISLPGMPEGSPGMSGEKSEPFTVYVIADGPKRVYAVE